MKKNSEIAQAAAVIHEGGIVAYPTEAVIGLGCDPFNQTSVMRLLRIKQRPVEKGLILIAANWDQLQPLCKKMSPKLLAKVLAVWPGPVTWVLPSSKYIPRWITGDHDTVAVRVTDHPIAKALCQYYGGPIVSTSANLADQPPARTLLQLRQQFQRQLLIGIDFMISGKVGKLKQPTMIRDFATDRILRSSSDL